MSGHDPNVIVDTVGAPLVIDTFGAPLVVDTVGGAPMYQPDPTFLVTSPGVNTGYPVGSWPGPSADGGAE